MSIPTGTRFHGVHEPVDTENKGSELANTLRKAYTLPDFKSTIEAGGPSYPFKSITDTYTILEDDCVLVFDFPSLKVVTLPLAASYPGKVLILRGEDGSDTCRLTRSGSDNVNDNSGNENYIEINANKSRTLVSDGVDTWYCVTGLGS